MTELIKQTGKLILIVFFSLALTTLLTWYGIRLGKSQPLPPQVRSMGPTVTQLERIGELTTTRVHVTDVLTAEGEGYRGSWLIKGDALLSCDMTKVKIVKVHNDKRIATIRLPQPRVISARVDHDKTKTWSVEKTSWLPWRWGDQGIVRDTAMFHAQKLVVAAAGSERHLTPAKAQAELLIRQMYEFVEWKVDVEWE
jgi:hypothetical protein